MKTFSSFFKKRASDQSRSPFSTSPRRRWGILIGLSAGLIYSFLEYWFDAVGTPDHRALWLMHKTFDSIVPVILGLLVGIGITLFQRNQHLIKSLSTQNYYLRSRLLANTLLAHILHEIRNPIHNLSALLEKSIHHLPQTDREIAERNLQRLNNTAEQLKRINGPWDEISARERTHLTRWLHEFLRQSVHQALDFSSIRYSENLKPVIVHMHPLLLEQCFTILFQNAIQACGQNTPHPEISLNASSDPTRHGFVTLELSNNGNVFPEDVLTGGTKKVIRSSSGMGIGLLLARDTLETVGGSLEIANLNGRATVKMHIPAETVL